MGAIVEYMMSSNSNEGLPAPGLDELDQEFGRNLRETRERMKISQRDLVNVLNGVTGIGWHQTTLAKTEKGERPVRLAEAVLLARVLPISLSALLPSPYAATDQTAIRIHELQLLEETIRRRREQLSGEAHAQGRQEMIQEFPSGGVIHIGHTNTLDSTAGEVPQE